MYMLTHLQNHVQSMISFICTLLTAHTHKQKEWPACARSAIKRVCPFVWICLYIYHSSMLYPHTHSIIQWRCQYIRVYILAHEHRNTDIDVLLYIYENTPPYVQYVQIFAYIYTYSRESSTANTSIFVLLPTFMMTIHPFSLSIICSSANTDVFVKIWQNITPSWPSIVCSKYIYIYNAVYI